MKKFNLYTIVFAALFAMPSVMLLETTVGSAVAFAQEGKPQRKTKRVESIPQSLIKDFEKVQAAFEADKYSEVDRLLRKIETKEGLNNITRAYIYNYRGNIAFSRDSLSGALREFKKILNIKEGLSSSFYNQIIYVVAQVYFSQENYREALNYAQRWFKTQNDPTADAYMLVGQAQYMLKRYDSALPNVQKGIQKYVDLGSVPKEGWLNLLSSIYRQKSNYRKMLPVLKQLVTHYPKKTYLLTMGGVYNELDDQPRMTAMYQALYDQGLLDKESELVTLASLQLSQDNPYKASTIMEKGINAGVIKKNLKNYRIYSQALYIAKEYEKALSPLSQAARLSKDGKLYDQLGQSYIALNRWKEADSALGKAISKGGLSNPGQTLISQGLTRYEQKKYESAKASFSRALKYGKTSESASKWIKYVDSEVFRIKELQKAIVINTDVEV